jgi:hypothetical protein
MDKPTERVAGAKLGLLLGVVITPCVAYLSFIYALHGGLSLAAALFPYAIINTPSLQSLNWLSFVLGMVQYPAYGVFLGAVIIRHRKAWNLIFALQLAAIHCVACLLALHRLESVPAVKYSESGAWGESFAYRHTLLVEPKSTTLEERLIQFAPTLSQSEESKQTAAFLLRWKDRRLQDLYHGAIWTLTHDYAELSRVEEVLKITDGYLQAVAAYERGDGSALTQHGGIKGLSIRLATWLTDEDQAVRAFSATMLGIIGDQSCAPQIASLLKEKEQKPGLVSYDRGRAALALGLLKAKEYTRSLVSLLSSPNKHDRTGAVQGLGWMQATDEAKAVAKLQADADQTVRQAARQALRMMGATSLIKDMREKKRQKIN